MDVLIADVRRFVHNQEHVSARLLRELKLQSGVEEETIAMGICGSLALYLMIGEQAQVIANFLLTAVPIFLSYIFVNECPANDLLLLHWSCFGVSTLIDPSLGEIQGYYLFKVLFFLALFLKPTLLCEKLLVAIKNFQESLEKDLNSRSIVTDKTQMSLSQYSMHTATPGALSSAGNHLRGNGVAQDGTVSLSSTSPTRSPAFRIEDAMVNDPRHALTPHSSNTQFSTDEMDPTQPHLPISFNDLLFEPHERLVFNGPFGDFNVTYYMTMRSNATRNIAYAIKSNAIPRITAIPPYGIIKPKERQLIAVTIQKFDYDSESGAVERDRIAFDYVFCSADVTKFNHKLFQGQEIRRRKNIKIQYNP